MLLKGLQAKITPSRNSICKSHFDNASRIQKAPVRSLLSVSAPKRGSLQICSMLSSSSTSNPAFSMGKLEDSMMETETGRSTEIMTVDGAVQKTSILLGVCVLSAAYTWMQVFSGNAAAAAGALGISKISAIVGLVASLATMFKPHWSPVTGLIFAAAQGLTVGGFSAIFELKFPGIVMNAMLLVFGTAASLLMAYQSKLISVTDQFRNGVMLMTGAYVFCMLGGFLLSMLGVQMPGILSGGIIGIGITLVATGLAAANLLLDFDMIKQTSKERMPKWFEWYSGFSLMVTLVWFYTNALKLLSMLTGGQDD